MNIITRNNKVLVSNGTILKSASHDLVKSGVIFIDYIGNVITTWEASEVSSKTSLPAIPKRPRLTAQGWNWDLQHIKSYIADYPEAIIYVGAIYKTTSGLTEVDIQVNKHLGKTITFNMVGNKDWGDGTQDSATSHTYTDYGEYTVTCDGNTLPTGSSSVNGMFGANGSNTNSYWCTAMRLKEGLEIPNYLAYNIRSLNYLTIPEGTLAIGQNAFNDSHMLNCIVLPKSCTRIVGYGFLRSYSCKYISISQEITDIGVQTFAYAQGISGVTIPEGTTTLTMAAYAQFNNIDRVIIPKTVTTIDSSVFDASRIKIFDFSKHTSIPTLANANALPKVRGDMKILVPVTLYDDWINATNWSVFAAVDLFYGV